MDPLLLLYIIALGHFIMPKLRLFFPKERITCVDDISTELQEHPVPAMNTPPAAARALVNLSGFCHSRRIRVEDAAYFIFCLVFLMVKVLLYCSVLGIGGGLVIYSPLLM